MSDGLPFRVSAYCRELAAVTGATEAVIYRNSVGLDHACRAALTCLRETASKGGKIMLVGNGGSAAIASHIAVDFLKMAGMPALALNDPVMLTCLGNDEGFEETFARQIRWLAKSGDCLIAMSCSGRSPNILRACEAAAGNCRIITFSGFDADNPLRALGALNFYVPSHSYGLVQLAHETILHAMVDTLGGCLPEGVQA